MPFGVNPATGGAVPTPDDLFSFIQWMQGATALGGPDIDTVVLGDGITATRGSGDTANVLTLTAAGGGGGGVTAYTSQVQNGTGLAKDGNFYPVEACDFTIYSEGTGISCDGSTFTLTGGAVYEFVCMFVFDGAIGPSFDDFLEFGVRIGGGQASVDTRYLPSETGHQAPRITATFLVPMLDTGTVDVEVFMDGPGSSDYGISGDILVRQVGGYNPS